MSKLDDNLREDDEILVTRGWLEGLMKCQEKLSLVSSANINDIARISYVSGYLSSAKYKLKPAPKTKGRRK